MAYDRLVKLLSSPCSVVLVKDVKIEDFDDYVYDVSIPSVEMFWGGTTPVLLHNSDERGLPMVRGRVKTFARLGTFGDFPFRLVVLDECDQITADAQTALRRIMEENSRTCRFILICNYSSKIIEPIQSRCAIFRFSNLDKSNVANYLRFIADKEGVKFTDEGFEALWEFCGGDLRRAINTLQASAVLDHIITEESVLKVVGKASPKDVLAMLNLALSGNFVEARAKLYELMIKYGLSGTDIIRQIHREILGTNLPEEEKMRLVNLIGEYDFRLVEGANEDIQLSALLAQLALFKKRG
jgi:replication factor C small subunit